jgi:hypothetical protein
MTDEFGHLPPLPGPSPEHFARQKHGAPQPLPPELSDEEKKIVGPMVGNLLHAATLLINRGYRPNDDEPYLRFYAVAKFVGEESSRVAGSLLT